MPPNLILIDGLPGSGKTTLAAEVGASIAESGRKATILYETTPGHPLHPVPTDEIGAAWPDIHLRISPEEFASESLRRWSRCVNALASDEALIVESFPFQSTVRVLLQIEASRDLIDRYWRDWQKIVQPRSPYLVYLRVEDPAGMFRAAGTIRGSAWTRYIVDAFAQMPFTARRGLAGAAAVEHFLETYAALIEELLIDSRMETTVMEGRPADYAERQRLAASALGI